MVVSHDGLSEVILRRLMLVCIKITAGISGISIVGWLLNYLILASISPAYIPMAFSTALLFIVLSGALLVCQPSSSPHIRMLARVGVILVLLISLIILIEFLFGMTLDIERLLMNRPEKLGDVPINRMSPITAVNFLLAGSALLLLLTFPGKQRARDAAAYLATFVVTVGLVVLNGYFHGGPLLYGGTIIPMALTTAVAFVFMGSGITAAVGQDYWPLRAFKGPSVRARLMRGFVPIAIAIILIGDTADIFILPLIGNHIISETFAAIFSIILVIFIVSKITQVIGGDIDRANAERKRADEELLKFKLGIERSDEIIFITDPDGKITYINPAFEKTYGFSKEEALGKTPRILKSGLLPPEVYKQFWDTLLEKKVVNGEISNKTKDGRILNVDSSSNPILNDNGDIIGFLAVQRNITERKKLERLLKQSEESLKLAQRISKFASWDWNIKEGTLSWSDEIYRQYDLEINEITPSYEAWTKFVHPDDLDYANRSVKQVLEEDKPYSIDIRMISKKGRQFFIRAEGTVYKDENGKVVRFIGSQHDITERKAAEEALTKSESRYRRLHESMTDCFVQVAMSGEIVDVNRSYLEMLGYTEEEVSKLRYQDITPAKWHEIEQKIIETQVLTRGYSDVYEKEYIRKDGSIFSVELRTYLLRDTDGKPSGMWAIIRDITQRKQLEEDMKESEERFRTLFESAPDAIFLADPETGIIIGANSKASELIALPHEEIIGMHQTQLHPLQIEEYSRESFKEHAGKTNQTKDIRPFENIVLRPDGTEVPVEVLGQIVTIKGRPVLQGVFRDITERKLMENKLRKSEERFRATTQSAYDAIIVADGKGNIINWNNGAINIFGYSEEEALGKPLTMLMKEQFKFTHTNKLEMATLTGKTSLIGKTIELQGLRKNDIEFPIELTLSTWEIGKERFYSGIIRDITERKQANDKISSSLEEKEVLLREIHHRVKNNMQIISSLLNLQAGYIEDKKYLDMLKDSQNRIITMALVHEKLYMSKNFTKINFKDYIHNLANSVFQSYSIRSGNILLDLNIENVELGIDSAIPCGLIINELVTNSLKHAFPGEKKGEIKIVLGKTNGNEYELTVSDNGIGIPEDIDFRNTKTLGLHLVSMLAEGQLSGKIKHDRSKGTEFSIIFGEKN